MNDTRGNMEKENHRNLNTELFNWIILASESMAFFNLSSLILLASSNFFSVLSIFVSSELIKAYKIVKSARRKCPNDEKRWKKEKKQIVKKDCQPPT